MALTVLRRSDEVNHGSVSCPGGNIYEVDRNACIAVSDAADVFALLEVGRPPQFIRDAGGDKPGFWRVVSVDGVAVEPVAATPPLAPASPPPLTPADPAAVKLLGDIAAAETAVLADEPEALDEAPAPVANPAPAKPVVGDWRQAVAPAPVEPPAPAARPACPATTRSGAPCRGRVNVSTGSRYCSAHSHLDGN